MRKMRTKSRRLVAIEDYPAEVCPGLSLTRSIKYESLHGALLGRDCERFAGPLEGEPVGDHVRDADLPVRKELHGLGGLGLIGAVTRDQPGPVQEESRRVQLGR